MTAAWPEVPVDGIWEDEHAALIPWADLTPPYAAIVMPRVPEADWGLANFTFEPMVELYYVGEVQGGSSGLRAKLETLRDDLLVNDLTTGQVMEVTELTYTAALIPNIIFRDKQMTFRAARLTASVVVGEGP